MEVDLTAADKDVTIKVDIEKLWNDKFPPLNLWNWQSYRIREIFYENQS